MKSDLPVHLQLIIDDICGHGCNHVNRIIETLQHEEVIEMMESLNSYERALVLNELKAIMTVYEQR